MVIHHISLAKNQIPTSDCKRNSKRRGSSGMGSSDWAMVTCKSCLAGRKEVK